MIAYHLKFSRVDCYDWIDIPCVFLPSNAVAFLGGDAPLQIRARPLPRSLHGSGKEDQTLTTWAWVEIFLCNWADLTSKDRPWIEKLNKWPQDV